MDWKGSPKPPARLFLRDDGGLKVELSPNRVYVFGRGVKCDFPVDDISASRKHAKMSVAGDVKIVHLEDLGSKNGTFVNDLPLNARKQLRSGDRIRIGKVEYVVEILEAEIELDLDTRTLSKPKEETASDSSLVPKKKR